MATFSDGGDGLHLSNMAGHSPHSASSGDMRFHLQSLLDSKEKQLQQAGTLGQQLLAQRMELEERIRQLQEMDFDGGDNDEVRESYRELVDTIKTWDTENEQLSSAFGPKTNGVHVAPSGELSRSELERSVERSKASVSGTTTAAQSSRRAKNAAHRADDVEFAFEIGSGLLTEVRRLQSLLAERDKAIQDMKEEKDDLEKSIESLRDALRQQEQAADKYKEENWNLEVTMQELRSQLAESQATSQRLEGEHKRLTKVLTTTREAVDQHKNEAERHHNAFMELKAKHEADVAQARRHAASLQRDKSDLQQTLDALKAEAAKASRRTPRFGSPLTPNGTTTPALTTPAPDEDDVFSVAASTNNRKKLDTSGLFPVDGYDDPDSSPEHSPSRPFLAPNHPSNEIEALQQRLAHAQRQVNTLKGSLQREKELRIEYKRKLDSAATAEMDEEDEEDEEQAGTDSAKPKTRLTPFRAGKGVRGRGRGRGGLTLMQRLAAHSPGSELADEDDLDTVEEDPSAHFASPLPSKLKSVESETSRDNDADILDDYEAQPSPSPIPPSNRTSVDGMDPAFANILRRSSSGRSMTHGVSPLRHTVFARASRGKALSKRSRGGAAYQEARPPSFAGEPEALANELGQLGFGALEDTFELPEPTRETVEIGCQTEIEETPIPSVVIQSPTEPVLPAEVMEIGIQVDPAPAPVTLRTEISTQTEPIIERVDAEVQHLDLTPNRVYVSTGSVTEPAMPEAIPTLVEAALKQYVDAQTSVAQPPPRQYVDAQTSALELLPETAEAHIQTHVVPLSEASVQVEHSGESLIKQPSTIDSSVGDTSEDTIIIIRPLATGSAFDFEEDDGTQTETGSVIETDTDDYVDARQSISLTTPTDSLDDYHSIMTVTDNDFSDSDEESIKASRMSSRQGRLSSLSVVPDPSPSRAEPTRTYESKGILAEPVEDVQLPKEYSAPVAPKDLRDTSIQTDEWAPPAQTSAPTSPTLPASPALFRVGPSSQQFQFISPPPSAGPTTTALPAVAAPYANIITRDSNSLFLPNPRTATSDRRQSIESTLSAARDEAIIRSRTPSNVASVVDKSRPPMMVLPPPPRQPPPPNSMAPPPFIPERRQTTSMVSRDAPPPRPLSPPPAELIQRATTPTFGQVLSVPGVRPFGLRHHPSSMASSQALRQPSSTGSFRSSARPPQLSSTANAYNARERREMSTTSLTSGRHSIESHRSSISSDHLAYDQPPQHPNNVPSTPERTLPNRSSALGGSTDPAVIHAITQTMIGEFLYKYTRRTIGKGHGERRHKRFFWVHPYTRTLYWSSADPGSSNVSESSAKSAYVEAVRSVLDPNPSPPGICQYSVVVSTPQREMKFTATTKERHEIWLNALQYLLTRPNGTTATSPASGANALASPLSLDEELPEPDSNQRPTAFASPQSQRSARTSRTGISVESWTSTPRGQRSQSQLSMRSSMGKRSGTPAAEYLRWSSHDSPRSPSKSFEQVSGHDENDLDFELHEDTMSNESYEGLENVRACCDGRHTVGRSGKIEHHHHHHHHQPVQPPSRARDNHLDPHPSEISRPVSPAWSFRSRAGSIVSNDGGGFFSRFGTRRSAKTITSEHR